MIDARFLNLITGGSDSERSDTYGITMGPKSDDLIAEYRDLRTKALAWGAFPTMRQREARRGMRSRAAEIAKLLKARGYDIATL